MYLKWEWNGKKYNDNVDKRKDLWYWVTFLSSTNTAQNTYSHSAQERYWTLNRSWAYWIPRSQTRLAQFLLRATNVINHLRSLHVLIRAIAFGSYMNLWIIVSMLLQSTHLVKLIWHFLMDFSLFQKFVGDRKVIKIFFFMSLFKLLPFVISSQ